MIRTLCIFTAALCFAAVSSAQTQSFNVAPWFFGKNVTSELPPGVIDLTDNTWASSDYTCPLVITGTKAAPATQLMCRDHKATSQFVAVIAENDPRLRGMRLAIPTTATNETGRYLTSMVRPGPKHLYFTAVTGNTPAAFGHQIAFRVREYQTVERVVGAGDNVTIKLFNGTTQSITLTAAGPMDGNADGREFVYLESNTGDVFGIFEIKGNTYELRYDGRIQMRDTPWGMGGFPFDDGGLVFKQPSILYQIDPNNCISIRCPLLLLAAEGSPFLPPSTRTPNLQLGALFRPTNDVNSFFFSWAVGPGQLKPPAVVSWWKDWAWRSFYDNQIGTPEETTVGTFAVGDRVAVVGTGSRVASSPDYDPRLNVTWPFGSLWIKRDNGFVRFLRNFDLPDSSGAPKKFYQGVTAFNCQVEFATKRDDASSDASGQFYGLYRLYRPCLNSAEFNTVTRELVIRGLNLMDQRTEVGVPPATPQPTLIGTLLPAQITSVTPTELRAKVDNVANLQSIMVLVNGLVWSDPVNVKVSSDPAPSLADLTDLNGDHTAPAPGKLMTLWGTFGCVTAQTQTVNYPTSLGNCSVVLNNGVQLPLLYASNTQINVLLPSSLSTSIAYQIRVNRTDANGVFSSGSFPVTLSTNNPVAIKANGNVIVTTIRAGQLVVLAPNDPIRPNEYFTIYVTGVNFEVLPPAVKIGQTDASYAAAVVNWAQGVVQMNILAPPTALGLATFTIPGTPMAGFEIRVN